MSVYVHSTTHLEAMLSSGYFRGTFKALTNEDTEAALQDGSIQDSDCMTYFVKVGLNSLKNSLSRLKARAGQIRAILIYSNKDGSGLVDSELETKYPLLVGRSVPLNKLTLHSIIAVSEDLGEGSSKKLYSKDIKPWTASSDCSNPFHFDEMDEADVKDEAKVLQKIKGIAPIVGLSL